MSAQDDLYRQASAQFGGAIERVVRGCEADPDKRRDLLQDIHLALWLSLERYEARCSLRTWVYRIAHNTATTHVIRQQRRNSRELLSLEQVEAASEAADPAEETSTRDGLARLFALIHRLKPLDRDLMLLYLEDLDAPAMEIRGQTPINSGDIDAIQQMH